MFTSMEENHTEPSPEGIQSGNPALVDQQDIESSLSTPVSFQTAEDTQYAVQMKNVKSSYGSGKGATKVLQGINLEVPEGVIYGLLGPSGCGKTTLLRCIVGRIIPNGGSVLVFGSKPGSKTSCVPGRGIGYMPQELALYAEFSIKETLVYFGRLQNLRTDVIKERTGFLLKFLDLPEKGRQIKTLSGGQQRRVSLAAALIHQPPLLVLDEPTVGVDPLLRHSIWKYLTTLTTKENMTVLITTHYIDEASQANVVGLMRKGRMLAEDSPTALMEKLSQPSMEDVFLKLCKKEADSNTQELDGKESYLAALWQKELETNEGQTEVDRSMEQSANSMSTSTVNLIMNSISNLAKVEETRNVRKSDAHPVLSNLKRSSKDSRRTILTLFNKNLTRFRRNPLVLVVVVFFPSIQIILFLGCIGTDPSDLSIAVVNEENPSLFSKTFLDNMDNNTIIQKKYATLKEAKDSVKDGHTWGAIHIGDSFSKSLMRRYYSGLDVDNATIDASTIKVYMDMSNQEIGYMIQLTIYESFLKFVHEMLKSSGLNMALGNLPVSIEKPIYGKRKLSFTSFVAPGFILSVAFYMGVSLGSLLLVEEKRSGLLDRSFVSGATYLQSFIGHTISTTLVLTGQLVFFLMSAFLLLNLHVEGSIILIVVITMLQSSGGLAYGFFISALCSEERSALMLSQGSIVLFLVVSGVVWPLEAMPYPVRYLGYCFPQTIPVEALRAIMGRGWNLTDQVVWSGLLISIVWLIVPYVCSAIIFSKRR